jgi:hypothetical protein
LSIASIRPKRPDRHQVLDVHLVGEPRVDPLGVVPHQVEELLDEEVADLLGVGRLELTPHVLHRHVVVGRREIGGFAWRALERDA